MDYPKVMKRWTLAMQYSWQNLGRYLEAHPEQYLGKFILSAIALGAVLLPVSSAAMAQSRVAMTESLTKLKQSTIVINRSSASRKPTTKKPRSITYKMPVGQEIKTRFLGQSTLYIATGATVNDINLEVTQNVINAKGVVLIPVGAVIRGQFVPASGGAKFVAQSLSSRGATIGILAESPILTDMKDPRETTTGAIATDAAIGGASGAVLGTVLRGSLKVEDIVGGAVAGAVIGNVTAPQVTVVEPQIPLVVKTLQEIQFMVKAKGLM